jgi:hypothetical protein
MSNLTHLRCGNAVSFEKVSDGYYAQCPSCDEDLYSFETEQEDPTPAVPFPTFSRMFYRMSGL